ncbi:MAG TPA: hypothetical protein VF937_13830 [Chloroflexota bacterium]
MHHPLTARREASPTGVIETLSAGYAAVNRQPWVLLLPIVLNVFLWLGPHVSYAPLVDPAVTHATEWTRQVALGPRRAFRDPQLLDQLDQTRQWLIAASDDTNGLAALAWGPIALPSLGPLPSASEDAAFVDGWLDGLVLLGACVALSLLLGGWFYGGLAAASTGARGGPLTAGRGILRAVADVLGLVALLIGGAVLLGVPVILLIGFTALVSPPVAVLGAVLLTAGMLFASIHLFFAIDAIFISSAGPFAAIQRSVSLVRRHLWPTVALVLLTWLILAGMGRVWDVLATSLQSPFGVVLGILGNAYVASGLIAAGMVFYTQRSQIGSASTSIEASG